MEVNQNLFKAKYKKLKTRIKNYVFENAALVDQVAQVQENILCAKEERRFLLKKLMEHEQELVMMPLPKRPYVKKKQVDGAVKKPLAKKYKQPPQPQPTASPEPTALAATKKPIQFDQITKHPIYPICIGFADFDLIVYNLGRIVFEKLAYHTETAIYPSGYKITRTYANLKNLDKKSTYTCRIVENGNFPIFEIMPDSNNPKFVISGNTPDQCHSRLIEAINKTPNFRKIDVRPQGDQFFGIDHPIISSLIKNFPNATKCVNFKGLKVENYNMDKGQDPTLSFAALQRHRAQKNDLPKISTSYNHAMAIEEIKSEPPEELF